MRLPDRHPGVLGVTRAALGRALAALADLDRARTRGDIERAVAGVRHELRSMAQQLGLDPDELLREWRTPVAELPVPSIDDPTLPGITGG